MPSTMANYVSGTVGIVCDTEDELHFVISHLQGMDVKAELMKHKISEQKQKAESKPKLRLKDDVDQELEKDVKEQGVNPISSLEID